MMKIRSFGRNRLAPVLLGILYLAVCGCASQTLPQAAAQGNTEKALELISQGDPIGQTWYGRQAIHYAAREQQIEIFNALVDKGADIDAKTANERDAPIHYAARNGDNLLTGRLITLNSDINATNANSDTPLVLSIISGHDEIAALLIEAGADVQKGKNAKSSPLAAAAAVNSLSIADLLADKGARLEEPDGFHNTPVIIAAMQDSKDVRDLLLDRGANPYATNAFGQGLMHFAAYHGDASMLRRLSDIGLGSDGRDYGWQNAVQSRGYDGPDTSH